MVDRNHSDLNSIISSGLADNSSGLITAELLRNIMTDTVDTMFSITQSSGTNFNLSGDTGPGHLVLAQSSGIRIVGGTNVSTTNGYNHITSIGARSTNQKLNAKVRVIAMN